jgi:cation transport ATPase
MSLPALEIDSNAYRIQRVVSTEPGEPDLASIQTLRGRLLTNELLLAISATFVAIALKSLCYFELFIFATPSIQDLVTGFIAILGLAQLYGSALPIAKRAWHGLRGWTFTSELCQIAALAISTGLTLYSLFFDLGYLQAQPLVSSLLVMQLILTAGRYAEFFLLGEIKRGCDITLGRADSARKLGAALIDRGHIGDIQCHLPFQDSAPRITERVIRAADLKPDDVFRVGAGETIPCDAEVIDGSCELRERRFTWKTTLKMKSSGQHVFAGSEVVSGSVDCKAVCIQQDSQLCEFMAIVNRQRNASEGEKGRAAQVQSSVNLFLFFLAGASVVFWNERGVGGLDLASIASGVLLVGVLSRLVVLPAMLSDISICGAFRLGAVLRRSDAVQSLASLKNLVVDYSFDSPPGSLKINSFEVLDPRIDNSGLISALLVILSDCDDPFYRQVATYLHARISSPKLLSVSDYRHYEGKGISATISGTDFSIGSEAFLIERGVHLDAAEVLGIEGDIVPIFVAIEDEVVARFLCMPTFFEEGRALNARLDSVDVRMVLCSMRAPGSGHGPDGVLKAGGEEDKRLTLDATETLSPLDRVGQSIGVELGYIFDSLDRESYLARLEALRPVGLFASTATPKELIKASDLSFSQFDDVLWDVTRTDFTLFDNDAGTISSLVSFARRSGFVAREGALFALSAAVLLSIVSFAGMLTPGTLGVISVLSLLVPLSRLRALATIA